MVLDVVPGWMMDLDRGPDWLFVRLLPPRHGDTQEVGLAETIWRMMEQSFNHRLVLEMEEVWLLRSWMVGELVKLHKRVAATGGTLRLCGMNDGNQEVLRISRLEDRFPQYRTRGDAVMGYRPVQPR
ncbi:MAG TPA: STAS domain-containing protein [Pirellulaceae bacterium]|nr:STAS domain-containing protein [Pirellulaceae bacterium]